MNKKGVSGVVSVVLLIVVAIVAVALLWGALRYMLKQDFSADELKVRLEVRKFVYDSTNNRAETIVEKIPGNAKIAGYKLVFSDANGENEVKSVSVELASLARDVSVSAFSEGFVPVNVEAFPFFLTEEGKEKVSRIGSGEFKASSGSVTGEVDSGSGEISALCVLDQEIPGISQSDCAVQICPRNEPMKHLNLPLESSCICAPADSLSQSGCTFTCENTRGCSVCEGKNEVSSCSNLDDFYSCQEGYEIDSNGDRFGCQWMANQNLCVNSQIACT